MAENSPELKKSHIHRVITAIAPKRTKGEKQLSRAITQDALEIISEDLNNRLKLIVLACEEALIEVNQNPNAIFLQKRYDEKVIVKALEKLRKRQFGGKT